MLDNEFYKTDTNQQDGNKQPVLTLDSCPLSGCCYSMDFSMIGKWNVSGRLTIAATMVAIVCLSACSGGSDQSAATDVLEPMPPESAPPTTPDSTVTSPTVAQPPVQPTQRFSPAQVIYANGVTTVQWGDIDRDGDLDLFAAEGGITGQPPLLAWFEAPDWERHDIGPPLTPFTGDSQLVDVDADNDLDLIISADSHSAQTNTGAVYWYENAGNGLGSWTQHVIEVGIPNAFHIGDMAAGDVDGNGLVDVVVRHLSTRRFVVYLQQPGDLWSVRRINTRYREGLALADLDHDGLQDIIGNGFVLFAPDDPLLDDWIEVTIDAVFYSAPKRGLNNSVKANTADINGDGRLDVILSPAEGEAVYLAWYEVPDDPVNDTWVKHFIESPLQNNHQVQIADVDLDGDPDVLGGFSFGDAGVVWWENVNGDGSSFSRHTIDGTQGCYSCRVGDFDGDGDWDFAGPTSYVGAIYLYENLSNN